MRPSSPVRPAPTLVEPAYCTGPDYYKTYGAEVAQLSEAAGYTPDLEQRLALDAIFAVDKRGRSASFEVAVVVARQNLKTGLFKQAALGWLFLMDIELVTWTAHKFATTSEAYRDLTNLIKGCDFLDAEVKHYHNSAQDRSIELHSGARIVFQARTASGGRGFSGERIVFDEAFALRRSHTGSLIPSLTAMPDPQLLYGSSAGHADSDVLRRIRDRGRYGLSARLADIEWCSQPGGCQVEYCDHAIGTPGCALDRLENLQRANPSLGRTRSNGTGLQLETILAERQAMDPAEYARERLGWWDDPGASEIFGAGKYDACGGPTPARAPLEAVAVAVTVDLRHAAVVGAGRVGARVYVQVLAHGPGYDWVDHVLPVGVPVLVASKGPAAVLIPDLQDQGVDVEAVDQTDECDAFAEFYNQVINAHLLHDRDPLLIASLNGAVTRHVGDREAWGRRTSTADISAIEAATLAAWWSTLPVAHTPPPPPVPELASMSEFRNELYTMGF